jgi:2-oxoglutarate ferredoxin oxidoreductase subunit alpha
MDEALDVLRERNVHLDALRLRAFPFGPEVAEFVAAHDSVFLVEQNRDAQMRTLLVNELGLDPARIAPVLNFDGNPITARFIVREIAERMTGANVKPLRKAVP